MSKRKSLDTNFIDGFTYRPSTLGSILLCRFSSEGYGRIIEQIESSEILGLLFPESLEGLSFPLIPRIFLTTAPVHLSKLQLSVST